jgi:AraC-like DNA-binding protein
MFTEKYVLPCGPTSTCGIALECIWDVHADETYDVPVERAKNFSRSLYRDGGTGLIAVRTMAGNGQVYLTDGRIIKLKRNTMVLLEWKTLRRYHCVGNNWHFLWFEFIAYGPLHIPLYEDICLSETDQDVNHIKAIQKAFVSKRQVKRRTASAKFLVLLYEWFERHRDKTKNPHEFKLETIISRVASNLSEPCDIGALAKEAGMSEAWFRHHFQQLTGSSPKRFFDRMRLAWADEMLRTSALSISEIAFKLGYSSPFHFSKAYRLHFRTPPSSARSIT